MKPACHSNIIEISPRGVRSLPTDAGERPVQSAAADALTRAAWLAAGALGVAGLGLAAAQSLPRDGSSPRPLTRRTALRHLALGAAALGLGLHRAGAQILSPRVENGALGTNIEMPNVGRWYTQCADVSGPGCIAPNWKNLTATGYTNGNYSGNNQGFSSAGGYSDMFVEDLPLITGALYQISWDAEIRSSNSVNDQLQFFVYGTSGRMLDAVNGTFAKARRSVLVVWEQYMALLWRFKKAPTTNSAVRFRVDNLQIIQLPPPTLTVENYSDAAYLGLPVGPKCVVWWPLIYDINVVQLYESASLTPASWVYKDTYIYPPVVQRDASNQPIGWGQLIPITGATKYYRLQVIGNPAI
ncbi:MAG: hypothetical protein WCS42_17365 [Verrucomicrobiota bacterium]